MCEADRQLSGRVAGCNIDCGAVKQGCPALNMLGSELRAAAEVNDTRHNFALSKPGQENGEQREERFHERAEAALAMMRQSRGE